jgi:hypothetical protein
VLSTPVPRAAFTGRNQLASMLPPIQSSVCISGPSDESRARERVAVLAVEARARGLVERRARYRFPGTHTDWANGMLGVPPFSRERADALVASVQSAIVADLRGASAERGVIEAVPANFTSDDGGCVALAR